MPTTPTNESPAAARRDMLGVAAAAVAAAAVAGTTTTVQAQSQGQPPAARAASEVLRRTIPRTNESLPAIGLGTFVVFDRLPGAPRDELREVVRRYWEGGARLFDVSPMYGSGETTLGAASAALGIGNEMVIANKLWATGDFLADDTQSRRSLERSMETLWRERIDIMHCHNLVNVDIAVPLMHAWKREGRIRHVAISHFENPYHPLLADWIRRGNLDLVQVNYSIANRAAEETVLPLAAERGVGVLANMPFEKARLFALVQGRPLPDFAREFGAETWASFFLKWVISHPAVTATLPATSNPDHAAQNVAALRGPLPDAAMRARMVRHMEAIPGFAEVTRQPWYPGKRYPGMIARAQAALRARNQA
jgi:diketogulonate reductase-like aldo/keto reductase